MKITDAVEELFDKYYDKGISAIREEVRDGKLVIVAECFAGKVPDLPNEVFGFPVVIEQGLPYVMEAKV